MMFDDIDPTTCTWNSADGAVYVGLANLVTTMLVYFNMDGIDINYENETDISNYSEQWTTFLKDLRKINPNIIIQGSPCCTNRRVENYANLKDDKGKSLFTMIAPQFYNSGMVGKAEDLARWPFGILEAQGVRYDFAPKWLIYLYNLAKNTTNPLSLFSFAVAAYGRGGGYCIDFGELAEQLNIFSTFTNNAEIVEGIKNVACWSTGQDGTPASCGDAPIWMCGGTGFPLWAFGRGISCCSVAEKRPQPLVCPANTRRDCRKYPCWAPCVEDGDARDGGVALVDGVWCNKWAHKAWETGTYYCGDGPNYNEQSGGIDCTPCKSCRQADDTWEGIYYQAMHSTYPTGAWPIGSPTKK